MDPPVKPQRAILLLMQGPQPAIHSARLRFATKEIGSAPQARPLTRQPNTLIEEIKTPNKDGSSFFLCTDIHPDSVHTHTGLSLGQNLVRQFNVAQSTKTQ